MDRHSLVMVFAEVPTTPDPSALIPGANGQESARPEISYTPGQDTAPGKWLWPTPLVTSTLLES